MREPGPERGTALPRGRGNSGSAGRAERAERGEPGPGCARSLSGSERPQELPAAARLAGSNGQQRGAGRGG